MPRTQPLLLKIEYVVRTLIGLAGERRRGWEPAAEHAPPSERRHAPCMLPLTHT